MDIEKQIMNIEKRKQLGYIIETENKMSICGIQKRNERDYLVYFLKHDFEFDHMDFSIKEYYSFSDLEKAIKYIISKGFPFDKFATRKGVNFFGHLTMKEQLTKIISEYDLTDVTYDSFWERYKSYLADSAEEAAEHGLVDETSVSITLRSTAYCKSGYLERNGEKMDYIEICYEMYDKQNKYVGYYAGIFDLDGNMFDDCFVIE